MFIYYSRDHNSTHVAVSVRNVSHITGKSVRNSANQTLSLAFIDNNNLALVAKSLSSNAVCVLGCSVQNGWLGCPPGKYFGAGCPIKKLMLKDNYEPNRGVGPRHHQVSVHAVHCIHTEPFQSLFWRCPPTCKVVYLWTLPFMAEWACGINTIHLNRTDGNTECKQHC